MARERGGGGVRRWVVRLVGAVVVAAAVIAVVTVGVDFPAREPAESAPETPAGPSSRPSGEDARVDLTSLLASDDTVGYRRVLEPRAFRFPQDHGPHPGFRTEWWYVTGHLASESGRRFGYQLTFFRYALAPPGAESATPAGDRASAWRAGQAYMAHFAVTDQQAGEFRTAERFSRAALGLAGAGAEPFRVWLEDWRLEGRADAVFPLRLEAGAGGVSVDLRLERGKPPVPQGEGGVSAKGPEPGNASYYYSLTRMPTEGRLVVDADTLTVSGASWMDREWGTSALGEGIVAWDWFALQTDDGWDLMYYRLRRADGSVAPQSRGSRVAPDGTPRSLGPGDVELEPRGWWESPDGGVRYPVSWRLGIPSAGLDLILDPVVRDQEWRRSFRYWEGEMDVRGVVDLRAAGGALGDGDLRGDGDLPDDGDLRRDRDAGGDRAARREGDAREGISRPVRGRGYLELTGYGASSGRTDP